MLTEKDEQVARRETALPMSGVGAAGVADAVPNRLARMLRIEWLGQTAASIFWICSMLVYGISSAGDWLQVLAASAWLLANIASIVSPGTN
ncbi:MAG: hypothetical protein AAF492_08005 [Verrucomicrobiota bacterium]